MKGVVCLGSILNIGGSVDSVHCTQLTINY